MKLILFGALQAYFQIKLVTDSHLGATSRNPDDHGVYFGLTTLGDAAASLVCDGKLVAAAEEDGSRASSITTGFRITPCNSVWIQPGSGSAMSSTSRFIGSRGFWAARPRRL